MRVRSSSVTDVNVGLLFLLKSSSHIVLLHPQVLRLIWHLFCENLLLILFFLRVNSLMPLKIVASDMRVRTGLTVMGVLLPTHLRLVLVDKILVAINIHVRESSNV